MIIQGHACVTVYRWVSRYEAQPGPELRQTQRSKTLTEGQRSLSRNGDCLPQPSSPDCPCDICLPKPHLPHTTPPFVPFTAGHFLFLFHTRKRTYSLGYHLINIIAICSMCNSPIRETPFDPTCPDLI